MRRITLGFSLVLAALTAWGEPAAPTGETESQQQAWQRLMDMANYLADAEKFRVNMRTGYEVVQDNGQKIEFGEKRTLSLNRPNQLRIEEQASQGEKSVLLVDGKNITMLDAEEGVYAQAPQPGNIDAAVMYFVRGLQMRLPLAPLLLTTFPEEMAKRVQAIDLVETTSILGQPTQHLAARTETVDFQVWISEGDKPLPLRIVLTYPQEVGQPQFWADFSEWNLAPRFASDTFIFKAPADTRQIHYAAQFAPATDASSSSDGDKTQGEKP